MPRKNPTLLPGKELYQIHFDALICAESEPGLLRKELMALFDLASQKGWIKPEDHERLISLAADQKEVQELWVKLDAASWHSQFSRHNPEEGAALAGWQVLYNLDKAHQIWRGYRRPYPSLSQAKSAAGLQNGLRTALRLAAIFEKNLPKEEQDAPRHLLALVLSLKRDARELEALNREALGQAAFLKTPTPKTLVVSHGMQTQGKWMRASLETVTLLIGRIEPTLPPAERQEISDWKGKLQP